MQRGLGVVSKSCDSSKESVEPEVTKVTSMMKSSRQGSKSRGKAGAGTAAHDVGALIAANQVEPCASFDCGEHARGFEGLGFRVLALIAAMCEHWV